MISPAKRHFQRKMAEQQAAGDPSATRSDANQYELMLVKLHEDSRRLKLIQSVQSKIELKMGLLPEYEPYIDGILAADSGQQDDVLMTVLLWRMDAADWAGALPLVEYALKHDLVMPDKYKRTTACMVAEEVADAAIKLKGEAPGFDIDLLDRVMSLTIGCDMPDQVRAKLHKALGYTLENTELEQALVQLQTAVKYHDKAGVKKDIERIERAIKHKGQADTDKDSESDSTSAPS